MEKKVWLGLGLAIAGLGLLALVDWRIAVGSFLLAWSNNIDDSYRRAHGSR